MKDFAQKRDPKVDLTLCISELEIQPSSQNGSHKPPPLVFVEHVASKPPPLPFWLRDPGFLDVRGGGC